MCMTIFEAAEGLQTVSIAKPQNFSTVKREIKITAKSFSRNNLQCREILLYY